MKASEALTIISEARKNGTTPDLYNANLRYADLRYADLRYADLYNANLYNANLRYANLRYADLSYADLRYADLQGAKVYGVKWPAPTSVLLASWGTVSDLLCVDLMCYDAYNHADPYSFDVWKDTNVCPFGDTPYQRAANFKESRALWPGWNPRKKVHSAYSLMQRLLDEKCNTGETR